MGGDFPALGIPVAIMTGENTQIVQKRADKLKIKYCYLGVKDKVAQARELCRELGISLDEVAFIGDDLNDLPLLRLVGYSASPANTPGYVKREAATALSASLWRSCWKITECWKTPSVSFCELLHP